MIHWDITGYLLPIIPELLPHNKHGEATCEEVSSLNIPGK
jgi:hypothetical protein